VGANNDGYWNSLHMAIQLEDCIDCCKVLYANTDILFLFDHSQGHNRKRKGALDARSMNMTWGGAQPRLRSSEIEDDKGYLGPYDPLLSRGDTQDMNWPNEVSDELMGPFHLSKEERILNRRDSSTGATEEKKKTKAKLKAELEAKGIAFSTKKKYT
jgi:hypothetical protein